MEEVSLDVVEVGAEIVGIFGCLLAMQPVHHLRADVRGEAAVAYGERQTNGEILPTVTLSTDGEIDGPGAVAVLNGTIRRKVKHHRIPAVLAQTRALELVSPTQDLSFEEIDS